MLLLVLPLLLLILLLMTLGFVCVDYYLLSLRVQFDQESARSAPDFKYCKDTDEMKYKWINPEFPLGELNNQYNGTAKRHRKGFLQGYW